MGIADTASPDDPTELSFKKYEILDILSKSDLWWEARKADGTQGSKFDVFFFSVIDKPINLAVCFISCSVKLPEDSRNGTHPVGECCGNGTRDSIEPPTNNCEKIFYRNARPDSTRSLLL